MKKFILLFLSLIYCSSIFGQWSHKESVNLNWTEKDLYDPTTKSLVSYPSFDGAYQSIHSDNLPFFQFRISTPINGRLSIIRTNEKWEPIKSAHFENVVIPKIESKITTAGSQYFVNISMVPIKVIDSKLMALKSFDIEIEIKTLSKSGSRGPTFASESILKEGTFFKLSIDKTGMYQISGQDLASNLSIDIGSINPKQIKLYAGNPGKLPEKVDADRIDDLIEMPIIVSGESDGKLDPSDLITFYASGPDVWQLDNGNYQFIKNNYSTENFVFIQIDGSNGLRMQTIPSQSNSPYVSSDYDFLQRYEEDKTNLLGSYIQTEGTGQDWYNDYFGQETKKDFSSKFDFEGFISNKDALVSYEMAARSRSITKSILTIDNNQIETSYSQTSLSNIESVYAHKRIGTKSFNIGNNPLLEIEYVKTNSNDEAWLDWIEIIGRRNFGLYGFQNVVRDITSLEHEKAGFSGFLPSGTVVYNVTELDGVFIQDYTNSGWNYQVNDKLQTFILVKEYLKPEYVGPLSNQNIHTLSDTDMVIIHSREFKSQAERLANHRAELSDLNISTLDVDHIYNEFSSGKLDPTAIRDFSKMIHDRSDNFKYLLLLGDGSFDHRNIVNGLADHNFVPAYQTIESLNPIEGFPTDDFYALLSDDEGSDLLGDLDISVGRIPVQNESEADIVIDKIIAYDKGENRFGDWRLRIGFAADDEDSNTHLLQTDDIAQWTFEKYPIYNQQKVYFDAFEQISTPGGDRFYDASNSINNNIQNGQLVLNYLGHGGPKGWAQERVLKVSDIDTWNNKEQLPILITATCSFTGYDDPNIITAGEYALRKKDGGCVALFTTVRAVYSNQNKQLADVIFDNIFELEDGQPRSLGDIMRVAKNSISSSGTMLNSRKFSLIGDPSMKIAVPTQKVTTTHINGEPVSITSDTINALEEVTISGMVTNQQGVIISDFNGTIYPTVYDKVSNIETLSNDSSSPKKKFEIYKNILFKGTAKVSNGLFTFSFIVPKDINYNFGEGRISYYADNGQNLDAAGFFDQLIIGGSSEENITDDEGPKMQLFMNDEKFIDGGIINKDADLLVKLQDDLGINVSGTSIGHDLKATLDDDEIFILNSFYQADENTFKSGKAIFPLNDLQVGYHTIEVKAWDTGNNSSTGRISFEVVDNLNGKVINIYNYPNPFSSDGTTFVFEHDVIGEETNIELSIYNSIGTHIATYQVERVLSGNRVEVNSSELADFDHKVTNGLYYFKIKLTNKELNTSRESDFEKFVKIE